MGRSNKDNPPSRKKSLGKRRQASAPKKSRSGFKPRCEPNAHEVRSFEAMQAFVRAGGAMVFLEDYIPVEFEAKQAVDKDPIKEWEEWIDWLDKPKSLKQGLPQRQEETVRSRTLSGATPEFPLVLEQDYKYNIKEHVATNAVKGDLHGQAIDSEFDPRTRTLNVEKRSTV